MRQLLHQILTPLRPLVPDTILPLIAVSAGAIALNALQVFASGYWKWFFLSWNLLLAWVPLFLAVAVYNRWQRGRKWTFKMTLAGAAWLLFFPNAPYLFTDLVHLGRSGHHYWLDLTVVSLFALTGLVLGFVSLRLMHHLVALRGGWIMGWLFTGLVAGLSAIGVYIGRFLRWNSWDALLNPGQVLQSLLFRGDLPAGRLHFTLFFAAFLFLAYVVLSSLTHLQFLLEVVPSAGAGQKDQQARDEANPRTFAGPF